MTRGGPGHPFKSEPSDKPLRKDWKEHLKKLLQAIKAPHLRVPGG
jgi:hypothetical protein